MLPVQDDHRFWLAEDDEPPLLTPIAEGAGNTVAIPLQPRHSAFHIDIDTQMHAAVLCRVRIISRPVRSPGTRRASCLWVWPPKACCNMSPFSVRSKSAPQCPAPARDLGPPARVCAMRQSFRNFPPRIVSRKWARQIAGSIHVCHRRRDTALGHHRAPCRAMIGRRRRRHSRPGPALQLQRAGPRRPRR